MPGRVVGGCVVGRVGVGGKGGCVGRVVCESVVALGVLVSVVGLAVLVVCGRTVRDVGGFGGVGGNGGCVGRVVCESVVGLGVLVSVVG